MTAHGHVTRRGQSPWSLILEVMGNVVVRVNAEKSRMQMVARDGIEPPTHGFSVRCSTS